MPVVKGFRGGCPCPLWLLELDNAVIVPLAKGRQTNPLYDARPHSIPKGKCLEETWSEELMGSDFRLAPAFGAYFLSAKVNRPNIWNGIPDNSGGQTPAASGGQTPAASGGQTPEAYINIWRGTSLESGTLYCALAYTPNCSHRCLCGWCRPHWLNQGWICPCLDVDESRAISSAPEVFSNPRNSSGLLDLSKRPRREGGHQ